MNVLLNLLSILCPLTTYQFVILLSIACNLEHQNLVSLTGVIVGTVNCLVLLFLLW